MSAMEKEKKVKSVAAGAEGGGTNAALLREAIGGAVKSAVQEALGEFRGELKAMGEQVAEVSERTEELHGLYVINAAGQTTEEDEEEGIEAGADEDEIEAGADDKEKEEEEEYEDDVDAEIEDLEEEPAEEEPGEVNEEEGDKNKGKKTTVTKPPKQGAKVPGNIAKGRLKSSGKKPFPGIHSSSLEAAAVRINTLAASVVKSRKIAAQALRAAAETAAENKKMRLLVRKMEAQVERAANDVNRRSAIPVEVRNLLAKGGVDPFQLQASGQKLSIEAMDAVFKACEGQGLILEPDQRAGMKNVLTQKGLLESGEIDRGYIS